MGAPVISGNHVGAVSVPAGGTLIVSGAFVTGTVSVGAGGTLDLENSTVGGSLIMTNGATIRTCGSTVNGAVILTGSGGVVLLGDPAMGCAANTFKSSVSLTGNHGGLDLVGNRMTVGVIVNDNTNGTATVAGNAIGGGLSCTGNNPPPTNVGNANAVTRTRSGQCATL